MLYRMIDGSATYDTAMPYRMIDGSATYAMCVSMVVLWSYRQFQGSPAWKEWPDLELLLAVECLSMWPVMHCGSRVLSYGKFISHL